MAQRALAAVALGLLCASAPARAADRVDEHLGTIPWARYQDEAVTRLQEYLRLDTSNPPGNERVAAEYLHRLFQEAGIASTVLEHAPGRASLHAVLKGDGSQRPLVLLSHLDVVGASPEGWRRPPFSGELLDGEIYGRGALDMKDEGLLHAMVLLIAARERLPLRRDLVFLATADEEVHGMGSAWILEHRPELVRGAEYVLTEGGENLVRERGPLYKIAVAEKAPLWLRLKATGRGGHGSVRLADSAPDRLVRALRRVVEWQRPVRLLPAVEQYAQRIAPWEPEPRATALRDLRRALRSPAQARALTAQEDFNALVRDTVSLTVLRSGQETNVIPDSATAELDVRLLPGTDPQAFLAELRRVLADPGIAIEPLGKFRPPNASPTDTELYRILERVIRAHRPEAIVAPALITAYTECQLYRQRGLACYGFAPVEITEELSDTEHATNERVPAEQIRRGLRLLYEVVARVAGPSARQ